MLVRLVVRLYLVRVIPEKKEIFNIKNINISRSKFNSSVVC